MKKLLSFLLILVGAMIFAIPGQSYADPQLDTLLNIATQARDNLSITISQINNVPDEINQLYSQGSNETDALAEAINQQDTNAAKQHFLAAMKFFQETNDQINSLNATSSNDQQKAEIIQLRGEVARLANMGTLLKSIASENNISINFTNFDKMIQSANHDLDSGNSDDASKQLENANNFVVTTHDSLTNIAQERISEREKSFAENQIVQLNNTNQLNVTQNIIPVNSSHTVSITNNSNVTIPATNSSNITVGSNPKDMVAELKQLVSEGKVDQAINLIKIIQAYQKAQSAEKPMEASSPTNSTAPIPTPPPVPTPPPQPTLSSPVNSTAPIPTPPPVPTPSSPTNSTISNTPSTTPKPVPSTNPIIPAAPQPTPTSSIVSLAINSVDLTGNKIPGMWVELHAQDGKLLKDGYTPTSFSVTSGTQYVVYASNYQNMVFDHWNDGSTNPYRTITPTQSVTLTVYYSVTTSSHHDNHNERH